MYRFPKRFPAQANFHWQFSSNTFTAQKNCCFVRLSFTKQQFCLLIIFTDYFFAYLFSIAVIISTLVWCLPPSNSALNHSSMIIFASSIPITRAPNARILVLLCCLESFAEYGSEQTTARTPFTLFAAREIPTPVPQIRIPRSTSHAAKARPTFSPYSG